MIRSISRCSSIPDYLLKYCMHMIIKYCKALQAADIPADVLETGQGETTVMGLVRLDIICFIKA
jgi:hypothetical protein